MLSKHNLNIIPGDFTGVYVGKITKIPQSQEVNAPKTVTPTTFSSILQKVSSQIKVSKPIRYNVQNVPNYLPFTALIGADVGPYGMIFANSVLRLCQYYKKTSPLPSFY